MTTTCNSLPVTSEIDVSTFRISKPPATMLPGHKFKYSGTIDETDYFHSTSIHEESGHTIAPHYYTLQNGKRVPYYHEPVYGTSTKYDPAGDCDGMFMASKFKANNNCYNYAVNIATNSFAQPGRVSGHPINSFDDFGDEVVKGALSDGLQLAGEDPIKYLKGKRHRAEEGHLVALLISMPVKEIGWRGDFHWVRCDNTWAGEQWEWSQKDGGDEITDFDFAGNEIRDPTKANWVVNIGLPNRNDPVDHVIWYKFKAFMYVPAKGVQII